MRILYHHRLGSKDGQYVHVEEIVGSLRSLGHEVLVAGPGLLDEARFGDGSGLVASLKRRLPRSIYECAEMLHGALTTIHLVQHARAFRPQVIYERYSLHLPAGGWAARLLGLPLLLEVNAPLAEERARFGGLALPGVARMSEARTWRSADAVLAVSGPLADRVTAAGVPAAKVHVVPNGVDPADSRPCGTRTQPVPRWEFLAASSSASPASCENGMGLTAWSTGWGPKRRRGLCCAVWATVRLEQASSGVPRNVASATG